MRSVPVRQTVLWVLWVLWMVLASTLPAARPAAAQGGFALPAGFIQEEVVVGLTLPTSFALAPDGRLFVTEKAGRVRVVDDGQLLATPFVDLSAEVNDAADRGLMGVAVDPAWPQRPYLYLAFVYDPPEIKERSPGGARVSRVLRLTADSADLNVAVPGSGRVLVGTRSTAAYVGNPDQGDAEPFSCRTPEGGPVADCIATEGSAHTIDMLAFGPEGALYVSVGDGIVNSRGNARALDIDSLNGKLLRVDADTGAGLPANPFYDGNPESNRSKVFALGLRNPFRFTVDPRNGRVIVGDVGNETWEEINIGGAGANFGWPCYEGPEEAATYADCDALHSGAVEVTQAAHAYRHTLQPQRGAAIGGDLYLGRSFPARYRGAYFYHDYNGGVTHFLTFDSQGQALDHEFATNMPGIVQIKATPDALYVLSIILGGIWRVRYVGDGNQPPSADASAAPAGGAAPLTVTFSSERSSDPEASIVEYLWEFGDGTSSRQANPTHTYLEDGLYRPRLTVTDAAGLSAAATVAVAVGSELPVAEILAPEEGARFRIGETVAFRGRAVDPDDGELTGSQLVWSGILHHNEHVHYDALQAIGTEGNFVLADHGDDTFLELCLTATDSQGLSSERCVDVKPVEVTYTFAAVPAGLQLTYNGSRYSTPFQVKTYVHARRLVEAPLRAAGGLRFSSWSDGGDAVHEITVGDNDQVLTARYTEGAEAADGAGEPAEALPPLAIEDKKAGAAAGPGLESTPSRAALQAERWDGVDGDDLETFTRTPQYRSEPASLFALSALELPRGGGTHYGVRIRGYLVPPQSGDYRFAIAADDQGALFLGLDADPAHKRVVAYTPAPTPAGVYEQFVEQRSGPLLLEAGHRYYIEVLYKQAGNKDHLTVAWQQPGEGWAVIDGRFLEPFQR